MKGEASTNIGIVNDKHYLDINRNFNVKNSYVFVLNGQVYDNQMYRPSFESDLQCKIGDKIKFIVDFAASTITIDKNDGEQNRIIINNIKKGPNIKYKFAIAMCAKGNCIQVMNE